MAILPCVISFPKIKEVGLFHVVSSPARNTENAARTAYGSLFAPLSFLFYLKVENPDKSIKMILHATYPALSNPQSRILKSHAFPARSLR